MNRVEIGTCTRLIALIVPLMCGVGIPSRLCGQNFWSSGASGTIYYNGGYVGIGTTNPPQALTVKNYSAAQALFYGWDPVGGISDWSGTISLGLGGAYQGTIHYDGTSGKSNLYIDNTNNYIPNIGEGNIYFRTQAWSSSPVNAMAITGNGNVGIGTLAPQYTLAVNGTIGAKEIIVTNSGWADYIFELGYRLRPLSEVGAYIRLHHRLPEMPSEAEIQENGANVGEIQVKVLVKIEELTLDMIRVDVQNRRLQRENRDLRSRMERLENAAGSDK